MLGFQICHLKKNEIPQSHDFAAPVGAGPFFLFETCLRKIWIAPEGTIQGPGNLQGALAYRFLLEVICGMQSPIFGETEILGQFKNFLQTQKSDPQFGFFKSWSQQLLEDSKALRTEHLQGQGQHSYGSLLRKRLGTNENLWIVGAGQLTEAMLPWLSEHSVTLWVRSIEKAQLLFPQAQVLSLSELPPPDATIVIAAPLSEEDLIKLVGQTENPWIDLREKTKACGVRPARITLADLYKESSGRESTKEGLRLQLMAQIQEIAESRLDRAWFRPQGWEDVCAS